MTTKLTPFALFICLLGATFYMYEFTLQVSVGVMTHELIHDLSLSVVSLGVASSFYYYGYTPMQIPAGILHDRFGPRKTLSIAILFCACGALLFSQSHSLFEASFSRLLMGIGSAFSFSGALLLISNWLPKQLFPLASGVVQFMSSIGAIFGGAPLAYAVASLHWRNTMVFLALFGFLLALTVWFIIRDRPSQEVPAKLQYEHSFQFSKLKLVFAQKQAWWIALYSFLVWAPIAAFAGLWGIPFLTTFYGLSTATASMACIAIWIGIGLSAPMIGFISEYLQLRNPILLVCSFLGLIGTLLLLYFRLPIYFLYFALFMFGIAGSSQSLAFSIVRDNSSLEMIGAAIGFNNMATVAGGAILQPLIGFLLHFFPSDRNFAHQVLNTATNYHFALSIIPICYLLAMFISFKCIKETHCQIKYNNF